MLVISSLFLYVVCSFVCVFVTVFFFFKQKTAYELRISDWSSDVCSSDLSRARSPAPPPKQSPATSSCCRRLAPRSTSIRIMNSAATRFAPPYRRSAQDRKSVAEGKSVYVRVDLGGRRIIKKKQNTQITRGGMFKHEVTSTTTRQHA